MVHRLDQPVGRIVGLVDRMHLTNRTLILFTSDNGADGRLASFFCSAGPYRGSKRHLTEGGIRVPLIARWPGTIPPGTVSGEVVAFQDIFPTLCELAGVAIPQSTDGLSMTAVLRGQFPVRQNPRYPIGQVYTGRPIWIPPWLTSEPSIDSPSGPDSTGS